MSYDTAANHQSAQPNKPLSIFGGFKKKVQAPKQPEPPKKSMYDFDDDPPAKKIKPVDKKTNDMQIRYQKNIESAKKQIKQAKELKKSEQINKPKYGPTIVDTSSLFGKKDKKDEEKKDFKTKNKNDEKNKELEAQREKEKRKQREKQKQKEMERQKQRERQNRNKQRQKQQQEKRIREKERKKRLEETERQDRAKQQKQRQNKNKERKTEKRQRSRQKKKKRQSSSSSSSSRNSESEDQSENEKAFKMLRGIDFMKKHYDKADIYRKRDRERIVESGVGEMMREDRHTYRIAEEDERRERERERRQIERRKERKKSRHQ